MPLLKPPQWTWNKAALELKFQHILRGAKLLLPFMEGTGPPRNLGESPIQLTAGSGNVNDAWRVGARGVSPYFDEGVSNVHSYYFDGWDNNAEFSFVTVLQRTRTDTREVPVAQGGAVTASDWKWFLDLNITGFSRLKVNGLTTELNLTLPGLDDTDPHVVVASCDGANVSCWVDGVKFTGTITGGLENAVDSMNPAVGSLADNGNTTLAFDGSVFMHVLWHRVLTDGEAETLSADPFGLLRPALLETVDVAVDNDVATDVRSVSVTTSGVTQTHEITATTNAVSTVTSALTVEAADVNLTADTRAVSTITSTITQTHDLTATTNSVSTVTSALDVTTHLTTSIRAASTTTADVTQTHHLTTDPRAVSTIAATLAAVGEVTRATIVTADIATTFITLGDSALTIITTSDN